MISVDSIVDEIVLSDVLSEDSLVDEVVWSDVLSEDSIIDEDFCSDVLSDESSVVDDLIIVDLLEITLINVNITWVVDFDKGVNKEIDVKFPFFN